MKNTRKKNQLKNKIVNGGSIIFKDGKMKKTDETYKGNPFFRKVFYYDKTNLDIEKKVRLARTAKAEIAIVNVLMNHPHPNIATYYKVNKEYVEMEELDIQAEKDKTILIESMKKVKDFLQSIGIMYIDWKPDNIGISKDGTYKLFDFDASGLVDLNTNKWIVKPVDYWSYNKAIENGCETPQQIDDFAFNYEIIGIKNKPCKLKSQKSKSRKAKSQKSKSPNKNYSNYTRSV
jgi:serine/threonine protein kinase